MEKKNTILLTVIAIATLLVAVVGATFAYFTATVNTTNDANVTTEVKTAALTSVSFDYGNTISSADGVVYPGYKDAKEMTLVGTCPSGQTNCQDINTTITVTANIASEFGTDVTWTLYQTDTQINKVTAADGFTASTNGLCATKLNTVNNQYYMDANCPDFSGATPVLTGNATDLVGKTKQVTVKGDDVTHYYYLVVDYKNNTSAAQDAQGKSFSVTMNYDYTK